MKLKSINLNEPAIELFDQITIWTLMDAYKVSKKESSNPTNSDKEYNRKLRKAIKRVLEHFGEQP